MEIKNRFTKSDFSIIIQLEKYFYKYFALKMIKSEVRINFTLKLFKSIYFIFHRKIFDYSVNVSNYTKLIAYSI